MGNLQERLNAAARRAQNGSVWDRIAKATEQAAAVRTEQKVYDSIRQKIEAGDRAGAYYEQEKHWDSLPAVWQTRLNRLWGSEETMPESTTRPTIEKFYTSSALTERKNAASAMPSAAERLSAAQETVKKSAEDMDAYLSPRFGHSFTYGSLEEADAANKQAKSDVEKLTEEVEQAEDLRFTPGGEKGAELRKQAESSFADGEIAMAKYVEAVVAAEKETEADRAKLQQMASGISGLAAAWQAAPSDEIFSQWEAMVGEYNAFSTQVQENAAKKAAELQPLYDEAMGYYAAGEELLSTMEQNEKDWFSNLPLWLAQLRKEEAEYKAMLDAAPHVEELPGGISFVEAMENHQRVQQEIEKLQQTSRLLLKEEQKRTWSEYYKGLQNAGDFAEYAAKGAAEQGDLVNFFAGYDTARDPKGVDLLKAMPNEAKYSFMTEEELQIYNYLLGKSGKKAAKEYAEFLEETLNQRQGTAQAEEISGKWAPVRAVESGALSMQAGLQDFGQGVYGLFSDEALPQTATQFAQGKVTENASGLGKIAYSGLRSLGNMAPSLITSAALTAMGMPAGGAAAIAAGAQGLSAGGNARQQALAEGWSKDKANTYGLAVGASEGALQYILGGIGAMGGVADDVILAKVKTMDSVVARLVLSGAVKLGSEIVEENLQLYLEPAYRSLIFHEEYDAPEWEEIVETTLVTAFTTAMLEGADSAVTHRNYAKIGKNMKGSAELRQVLTERALLLPESSEAHVLADRILKSEKPSAHDLGQLYVALQDAGTDMQDVFMDAYQRSMQRAETAERAAAEAPAERAAEGVSPYEGEEKTAGDEPAAEDPYALKLPKVEQDEAAEWKTVMDPETEAAIPSGITDMEVGLRAYEMLIIEDEKIRAIDREALLEQRSHAAAEEARLERIALLARAFEQANPVLFGKSEVRQAGSLAEQVKPTYEAVTQKKPMSVIDIGNNQEGKPYAELKTDALQTARRKGWLEEPLHNEDTDSLWFVSNDTLTHSFSNIRADRGEIMLLALQHLDEIVQDARLVSVDEPKNPNKAESRVHTFFAAVRQGKDVVPVKMTVKEYAPDSTRSLPENVKKYVENHGEVDEYAKLYDVVTLEVVGNERETTDASGNGSSAKAEGTTTPMVSEISVADLLALVNGNARKYIPPQRENREGGTENVEDHASRRGGTDLSDGDQGGLSGESAGEQAGRVSGRRKKAGPAAEQAGKAIARQAAVREGKGVKRSSLELGVTRGTDDLTMTELMPEDWDADLQAVADEVKEKTGLACRFVVGAIPMQGTKGIRYARGVYTGTDIIVQADNPRITAAQIARHEMFHHMASEDRGMAQDLADRLILNDRTESSRKMVEAYIQNYQGIIDIPEDADQAAMDEAYQRIYEEILADAYAGINAFGAGATRYTETVREYADRDGRSGNAQTSAATDRTTGPPAERYLIAASAETEELNPSVVPATQKESLQMDATDPRNVARYRAEVAAALDGTLPATKFILLGKPSAILQKYMNSSNALYMPQKAARKGALLRDKGGKHGLGRDVLYDLPYQFADPLAITGNTTAHEQKGEKSIVVWTDWITKDGASVIVPIRIDAEGNVGLFNNANTVFDAFNPEYVEDLLRDGNVLYTRNGRNIRELLTQQRQVLKRKLADVSRNSIRDTAENSNTKFSETDPYVLKLPKVGEESFSVEPSALAGEVVPEYDRDMAEQAARKQGYPVISGVQVVPNKTYVRTEKRQNYGLVIGTAPNDANGRQNLWVMFKNKQDGTMATVALPVDELQPTDAMYQPTYEELESLLAGAPEEVTHEDAPEDYYGANERVTDNDPLEVELEKMPVKAKQYLQRAERAMIASMARALHLPGYAQKEFLNDAVREISREVVRTGTVEDGTVRSLFEKAYAEGRVVNREFYDQYKPVKDYLRTQAVTLPEDLRSDAAMAMGFESYEEMRRKLFGSVLLTGKNGLSVDVAYDELRDMAPELFPELLNLSDMLERMQKVSKSIAISEESLDEYYGKAAGEYKKWAAHDFQIAVEDLCAQLRLVRRYVQDRKTLMESETPSVETVMEIFRKLPEARKAADKATARELLTERDLQQVKLLLRGELDPAQLDADKYNVKGILNVFAARQEYEMLAAQLRDYRAMVREKRDARMDELLSNVMEFTDKKAGVLYARETMTRNIRDIAPDAETADRINRELFRKVSENDAAIQRDKARYQKRIEDLELSQKVAKGNEISEAAAVQLYGEATDAIRMLEDSKGRLKERDGKKLVDWRAELDNLWANNPNLDRARIENAVEVFHEVYNELFERMNEVRVRNGYEPIKYRRGYFPHFSETGQDGLLSQLGKALGVETDVTELPTTIAGTTHTFKPGIRWFGHVLERMAGTTTYDAVKGFDKYLAGALDMIHHTDDVQNLRSFAARIRYNTAPEGLQRQIDEIRNNEMLSEDEKQEKTLKVLESGKYQLSNFVQELDEYTNLLANKRSKYDRMPESLIGRGFYDLFRTIESRVGANMVAANLSSALTNFIPITQAWSMIDTRTLLSGMADTVKDYYAEVRGKERDGFQDRSEFLTNRRGVEPLSRTGVQDWSDILSAPMEFVDNFTSDTLVRARVKQNLKRGMSEEAAIYEADGWAADIIAARNKGAMPTLFAARNPIYKLFTQFQLEVNNQVSVLFKDMPREMKARKKSIVFAVAKLCFGAWLYDELYEKLVGRRAALDPINTVNEFVGDVSGYELPNTLDLFGAVISGEEIGELFKTDRQGVAGALGNLGLNVLEDVPFVGGVLGGGRLPVSSAFPDFDNLGAAIAGNSSWSAAKRWDTIGNELLKPAAYLVPPFGGGQMKKIYQGVRTAIEGGSYSLNADGEKQLQYPLLYDNGAELAARAAQMTLLGKTSLPTAQDWIDSGFDTFSVKETAAYDGMIEAGASREVAYDLVRELSGAKKTEDKSLNTVKREILISSDLSGDAKSVCYYAMLASDKEMALMDLLEEGEADMGEVTAALVGIKDAEALRAGSEKSIGKREAILQAELADEDKVAIYTTMLVDEDSTEPEKIEEFLDSGAGFDAYLEMKNAIARIEPEEGKKSASTLQKFRAIVDAVGSETVQLAAMKTVMAEKAWLKLQAAGEYGVSPEDFVEVSEAALRIDDGNGRYSQKEVVEALNQFPHIGAYAKAALWQILTGAKEATNNPYSKKVGQEIVDAAGASE